MLHWPEHGHKSFEVTVYNREVRALVKQNRSHSFFDDHWADRHVCDVEARNEAEARAVAHRRFPPEDGFVIEDVNPSPI